MSRSVIFRVHAILRMHERRISVEEVEAVLADGELIEDYPEDTPFPSRLLLGWNGSRPLHLVAATNQEDNVEIVITVYEPDLTEWLPGFRRRRVQ